MNAALIVAFHFPPFGGGSGILRILKFCRYLPESGWQPIVLTANTRAYEHTDSTLLSQISPEVHVVRAFALDAQRHLSLGGHYSRWLALPDRWATWLLAAVVAGTRVMRRYRVGVILTTYPIATAVLIGLALHKLTGKPWVVDFRDSMTEEEYPSDPLTRKVCRWIEKKAVKHAALLAFTAISTLEMYRKRYPDLAPEKCLLIPNGYDEEDFKWLPSIESLPHDPLRPFRLIHLGAIYTSERDPRPFFRALARLKQQAQIDAANLRIELRASGSENYYSQILRDLRIEELVHLLPALPYPQVLLEAAASDGLLLFQAANCDHQIPAKAYEYLRLGKPIFALTTQTGDTAALLRQSGGATIVDLADEEAIFHALPQFIRAVQNGKHSIADLDQVRRYARKNQAHALARYLSGLVQTERADWRGESERTAEPGNS